MLKNYYYKFVIRHNWQFFCPKIPEMPVTGSMCFTLFTLAKSLWHNSSGFIRNNFSTCTRPTVFVPDALGQVVNLDCPLRPLWRTILTVRSLVIIRSSTL